MPDGGPELFTDDLRSAQGVPSTLRGAELLQLLAAERSGSAPAFELDLERRIAVFPEADALAARSVGSALRPSLAVSCERALRKLLALSRGPARAALLACFFYIFVFSFSVVRGSSMSPGIHDGDRILIDQISHHLMGIERGDIVVLRYPLDPRLDYIKRVVGLPGDKVVMAGGAVWINGRLLEETYVDDQDPSSWTTVRVQEGHVFVLGDNRPHSSDSREFGQVPLENVRGRVDLRVWPPARFGWLR